MDEDDHHGPHMVELAVVCSGAALGQRPPPPRLLARATASHLKGGDSPSPAPSVDEDDDQGIHGRELDGSSGSGSSPVGRRSGATPTPTEYCLGYNLPRAAGYSSD